jgi:hypothetical protein
MQSDAEGDTEDMCGDAQRERMVTLKVTLNMTLLMTNDKCRLNYTS